ncbi:hypothetical protein [Spirobacillus cienkowskii]|jgi:hypothetical protein|uniref:Uncharacterized protein n=1 Tax=Spirobacillus cienkowskii TaxID=495820 RepID=A0A369KQ73_9BACT|nr:MAG: hypothetical protein DCC88_09795 [Spirobacillus cienkowskii]
MSKLEILKKRKEEIENTLNNLQKLFDARNAFLANYERLAFERVIKKKRTLLNVSNNKRVNFMRRLTKSSDMEMKKSRLCIFYLNSRKLHLIKTLDDIKAELDILQTTGNNFVPNE